MAPRKRAGRRYIHESITLGKLRQGLIAAVAALRYAVSVNDASRNRRCARCAGVMLLLAAYARAGVAAPFTDDAARTIEAPAHIARVFAAGAPAELLLYTLAPEAMVGRNHLPPVAALPLMPAALRAPHPILQLPHADDARNDAEMLALAPDLYLDYGDVSPDYVDSLNHVQERTHVPAIILDGHLARIPDTYRRLGQLLGVARRGTQLAKDSQRLLDRLHRTLSAGPKTPRAYFACSGDLVVPCLGDSMLGEAPAWLGAVNVADGLPADRGVGLKELTAWDPDVIIASSAESAARIRQDPTLQTLRAVAAGRVYAPPSLPYSWGSRPPSVNRLLGMIWLAYVLPNRPLDRGFEQQVRDFFRAFYHVTPSSQQIRDLLAPAL